MSSSSCGGGGGGAEPSDRAVAEEEGVDHFDRLPDAIVLVVLNRVGDVKALGRCSLVSRRFRLLVPSVDRVLVRVDCVVPDDPSSSSAARRGAAAAAAGDRPRGVLSHLSRFFFAGLVKPFQALGQIFSPASGHRRSSSSSSSSGGGSEVSHRSPTEVLKSFTVIRHLGIELPAGELTVDDGLLIKWKAGFGSTLDSCVILCASSVSPTSSNPNPNPSPSPRDPSLPDDGAGAGVPDSFYSSGKLKLRVVWTISALIAASARHYLLRPIIAEHATLRSLSLTDADGQGELTMDARQLQELRVTPVCAPSGHSQRTPVPALSMLLWYAPLLELPAGPVLRGATLVAVWPNEEKGSAGLGAADVHGWVSNAFEEPYGVAAGMLVKRRTYCLEMNSF